MNRCTRGMTLIEVLVALAIFATAAISVMKSVTQHINTLSYLEEKTFASLIVDNQISRVMLAEAPKSTTSGKVSMVGKEWYWKVTPVETAVGFIAAFDVSVSLDKTVKKPIVTVRSYVDK